MNKETKNLFIVASILTFAVVCLIVVDFMRDTKEAGASAPSGLSSTVATSSEIAVSTTAITVFATSTLNTCASRIISTNGDGIMMTFTDKNGDSPTAVHGHYQAASTTIAYDAGLYGCGAWKIYGIGAGRITVTETR